MTFPIGAPFLGAGIWAIADGSKNLADLKADRDALQDQVDHDTGVLAKLNVQHAIIVTAAAQFSSISNNLAAASTCAHDIAGAYQQLQSNLNMLANDTDAKSDSALSALSDIVDVG
jgi:hypothetical protein